MVKETKSTGRRGSHEGAETDQDGERGLGHGGGTGAIRGASAGGGTDSWGAARDWADGGAGAEPGLDAGATAGDRAWGGVGAVGTGTGDERRARSAQEQREGIANPPDLQRAVPAFAAPDVRDHRSGVRCAPRTPIRIAIPSKAETLDTLGHFRCRARLSR